MHILAKNFKRHSISRRYAPSISIEPGEIIGIFAHVKMPITALLFNYYANAAVIMITYISLASPKLDCVQIMCRKIILTFSFDREYIILIKHSKIFMIHKASNLRLHIK